MQLQLVNILIKNIAASQYCGRIVESMQQKHATKLFYFALPIRRVQPLERERVIAAG